jgi:hypothetical protein
MFPLVSGNPFSALPERASHNSTRTLGNLPEATSAPLGESATPVTHSPVSMVRNSRMDGNSHSLIVWSLLAVAMMVPSAEKETPSTLSWCAWEV